MIPISGSLAKVLDNRVMDITACIAVIGRAGASLHMTELDYDLEIDGVRYRSDISFNRSAVKQTATLDTGDMEIQGFVTDDATIDQFQRGLFNQARAEAFLVAASDPTSGRIPLITGSTGVVKIDTRGRFQMEIRDLKQFLSSNLGNTYQAECRADLSDSLCTVDLASYTSTGSVASVTTGREYTSFTASGIGGSAAGKDDTWFAYGVLTWTSGNNQGVRAEVRSGSTGAFQLAFSLPAPIEIGDTFTVYAGCDKRLETCESKFDNILNFQGEPDMPGDDYINDYIVPPLA